MSKVKIYIGNSLLDFTGVINVKRQVKDYRDQEIGTSNKSYSLDIPMTPTNRLLLKFANDLRSRQEVSDLARIVVDEITIIQGRFRILSMTTLYVKAIIEADDWIDDIAGVNINDLSWVSGDQHSFTAANVSGSWTAAAGAFYRYPLINFSELISEGYGPGGSAIYPYEFYPAWNIADIVEKIFSDAGYALAGSGFFASAMGQALYILSHAKPLPDDFLTGKALHAYVSDAVDNLDSDTAAVGNPISLAVTQVLDMGGEVEDEGSDYNTGTGLYTAPADGTYRFQGQVSFQSDINDSGFFSVSSNTLTFSIRKNSSTTLETMYVTGASTFDVGNSFALDTGYIHLEAGDTIELYIDARASGTNITGSSQYAELYAENDSAKSFLKAVWDEQCLWPGIGKAIGPAEYLPAIDGIEFLKGLKEAFNLRFWVDRPNRTIYIETSNDFYGSTVIDLSDKIDYSEEIEMEVLASNYKRTQIWRWRPDQSDKAYKNEESANGIPFTKELTMESEYAEAGIDEYENSVFAPTPTGDMSQIGHWSGQLIPRIFGNGEFVSSIKPHPQNRAKSWEPRILEWKGMVAMGGGNFDWYEDIEDASGTNYTTFPSMVTPDMSDLFDDYMYKDWSRIDNNKLLTCVLKLSAAEIIQFNTVLSTGANEGFRATYKLNIEGTDMLFLLNKITTDGDRVKCEFVQKL